MTSHKRPRSTYESDLHPSQSTYTLYGTPLPPLDASTRDDGSYVPIWQQEVRDERGRKRLHGAFTGGFSAGYFNTVGSKEGWTPSTFVSSRSKRAGAAAGDGSGDGAKEETKREQRPEDFMDEEDLREAEEERVLKTNKAFSALGSTAEDMSRKSKVMDLLGANGAGEETVGVKLLKRMGWKEGQGVGPKVRRKAEGEEEDGEGKTYLFAPPDVDMVVLTRKFDRKGVGFSGEARLGSENSTALTTTTQSRPSKQKRITFQSGLDSDSDDDNSGPSLAIGRKGSSTKKKNKEAPRRSAFGVGVLNDTGSDDEDPYSTGPHISYSRTIGSEKKKPLKQLSSANPLLASKPIFISSKKGATSKSTAASRLDRPSRCYDGKPPLPGFILASTLTTTLSTPDLSNYPPPKIPPDWKSSKPPLSTSSQPQASQEYTSTADLAKSSTLTASSRAALLGETPLPGKSVFDFLSTSARSKLVSATGRTDLPAAKGESAPKGWERSEEEKKRDFQRSIPFLDPVIAKEALARGSGADGKGGFMPYADDPEKRNRYITFLEYSAYSPSSINNSSSSSSSSSSSEEAKPPLQPPQPNPGISTQDFLSELSEFTRAATVFRPVSGTIASRFVSSSSSTQPGSSDRSQAEKKKEKESDPAEEAARLGMYGPLTRSVGFFVPGRLVCKRFNVRFEGVGAGGGDTDARGGGGGSASTATAGGRGFASGGFEFEGPSQNGSMSSRLILLDASASASASSPAVSSQAIPETQTQTTPQIKPGLNTSAAERNGAAASRPVVIDIERNEALEKEKAADEVFRAVFGSDSEDE